MDTQFKVINRTTREEQIFNSSEFKRFFECWYDEQTQTIKYNNEMKDYAISTVKPETQTALNAIIISIIAVSSVILITKLVMLWI
jgi:hypothetical protein|tara:strand:+ start:2490 stop:2744 length:255 start_codon:yes stop_codon:yes gene_type:complete